MFSANDPLPAADTHTARVATAKLIVNMFWPERFTYLLLSAGTACLVVFEATQALHDPAKRIATIGSLFGSGGVVAFNLARLLTMFNKVIATVFVAE